MNPRRKRPIHGSTRIPLLLKTPTGSYVLKRYDDQEFHSQEKVVSERLEGKVSPKVLVYGRSLFVEEYLDPKQWLTLDVVQKKILKKRR